MRFLGKSSTKNDNIFLVLVCLLVLVGAAYLSRFTDRLKQLRVKATKGIACFFKNKFYNNLPRDLAFNWEWSEGKGCPQRCPLARVQRCNSQTRDFWYSRPGTANYRAGYPDMVTVPWALGLYIRLSQIVTCQVPYDHPRGKILKPRS